MYLNKQRNKMFTPYETEVLINIIKYHKNLDNIEATKIGKPGAVVPFPWRKIQQEFFEKVGEYREVDSLKNRYKYWKKAIKKTGLSDPFEDVKTQLECKPDSPETVIPGYTGMPDILKTGDSFQNCLTNVEVKLECDSQSSKNGNSPDGGIPVIMQTESLALSRMELERRFLEEEHELRMKKLKLEIDHMQKESELRQEKLRLEIEFLKNSYNQ